MASKKKKSRKTQAIQSVLFNWAGRICSFGISFILTPIVLHSLGGEAYGIWAIVMAAAGYYTLADCGFQAASIKYIAEYNALDNREALRKLVATTMTSYSIFAIGIIVAGGVMSWVFPASFTIQAVSIEAVGWTVFLSAVTVAVQIQGQIFRAVLRALNRFDLENIIAVSSQVLSALAMIFVVHLGYGLVAMAIVNLLAAIVVRGTEAVIAKRLLPDIRIVPGQFDKESFRVLFGFSAMNVVRRVCNEGRRNSGSLIIGWFLGPIAVPYFAVAHTLIKKTQSLTQSVSNVVLPVASELQARQQREQLVRMMILVPRVLVTMSMAAAVVFVMLGQPFLKYWIGEEFVEKTYIVLCILSFGFVANMFSGAQRQMLAGTGQIRAVTVLSVISAILQVGLSLVLVPTTGVAGVAWADFVSSVIINVFACNYLACRTYGYPWGRYLVETILRPLPSTAVAYLVATGLAAVFPVERTLHVAMHAIVILGSAGLTAFLCCLDHQARCDILRASGLDKWIGRPRSKSLAVAEHAT